MTHAEAVWSYLSTLSPVTALVSGRIFTLRFPQGVTLPAILVQQIGEHQLGHLRGTEGRSWARIQVDVLADSIKTARAVDQAVMGWYESGAPTGLLGANTVIGSPGQQITVSPETMGYLEEYEPDERKQARVMRDYKVWLEHE